MNIMKSLLLFFVAPLLAVSAAQADEGPTNIDNNGHAIEGYDVVAYFTQSAPVKGVKQYSYRWNYGTWLFSSAENLAIFKESPEKYAPQYGGYCAYAAAKGGFAPIEPDHWVIRDAKLYLNYNARINKKWNKKHEFYIKKADVKWPELLDEALENVE